MAKKKAVRKTVTRKLVRTTAVPAKGGKKVVKKRTVVQKKTTLVPAKAAKKGTKKRVAAKTLGRPLLTGDAKLDVVFQKDYQAREIFAFLRVETVRELEKHAPDEIIERLTGPMVQTVQRIRKALAMANRCLAGDRAFAADFKSQVRG